MAITPLVPSTTYLMLDTSFFLYCKAVKAIGRLTHTANGLKPAAHSLMARQQEWKGT